jgi:hypothetical protein
VPGGGQERGPFRVPDSWLFCLFLWQVPGSVSATSLPILPSGLWGPLYPISSIPTTFGRELREGVRKVGDPTPPPTVKAVFVFFFFFFFFWAI